MTDVGALATAAVTLDTRGEYELAVQAYVRASEACIAAAPRERLEHCPSSIMSTPLSTPPPCVIVCIYH